MGEGTRPEQHSLGKCLSNWGHRENLRGVLEKGKHDQNVLYEKNFFQLKIKLSVTLQLFTPEKAAFFSTLLTACV